MTQIKGNAAPIAKPAIKALLVQLLPVDVVRSYGNNAVPGKSGGLNRSMQLDRKGSSKAMGIRRLLVFAGLLVVLCACFLLWFARFWHQAEIHVRMAVKTAEDSASLKRVLGRPITRSGLIMGRVVSTKGNGTADISVKVSGPMGRGKLLEWAQETEGHWQVCSLTFQPANGTKDISIVPDETSHCERE